MMVEPDILVRRALAEYLRACGYKVIEGVSAEDGFALASRLRETHPGVDVLLSFGIANAAEKAGDLCENGPLEKPYHPHEVIRRSNLLCERRRTSSRA